MRTLPLDNLKPGRALGHIHLLGSERQHRPSLTPSADGGLGSRAPRDQCGHESGGAGGAEAAAVRAVSAAGDAGGEVQKVRAVPGSTVLLQRMYVTLSLLV